MDSATWSEYMQATVKNGSRTGRGFSLEELKEAGLDARTARKHGIPTDVWRTTKYGSNVEALRNVAKSIKEAPKKEEKKKSEQPPQPAKRKTAPAKKPTKKTKKSAKKTTRKKQQKKRKK